MHATLNFPIDGTIIAFDHGFKGAYQIADSAGIEYEIDGQIEPADPESGIFHPGWSTTVIVRVCDGAVIDDDREETQIAIDAALSEYVAEAEREHPTTRGR